MSSSIYNPLGLGAVLQDQGVAFKVWAPFAESVAVVGDFNGWNGHAHPLKREERGYWLITVPEAKPGQTYQFEIGYHHQTFRKNDPYAREIDPESKTSVVYRSGYRWKQAASVLPSWNDLVVYELHVGTFAPKSEKAPGTFASVERRLPYLKHLGVNAIEIMPLAEFPTDRSWGYNMTNPFAVESSYGGPEGLKQLIDAAHGHGIAVILDVVYNHYGPDQLDLWRFDGWSENELGGIYFYNNQRSWTPWGNNRPDYGRGEVRQYIRDNALLWLEEFHVDGLRFDATSYIRDIRGNDYSPETEIPEGWTLLQWINDEVQRYFPGKITIAEDLTCNVWVTKPTGAGGAGFGAQWDAAFVHPMRANVIAIEDGQRSMGAVGLALGYRYNDHPFERVIYSESHDEVANGKARVPTEISPNDPDGYFARKRSTLAAAMVFAAPGIPMIFEGQEFLQDGWFRDDVAVDWSKLESFQGINLLYRDLIHLRRNTAKITRGLSGPHQDLFHSNDHDKVVAFHRWQEGGPGDSVVIVANFSNSSFNDYWIGFPREGEWVVRMNSDWKGYSPDFPGGERPMIKVNAQPESAHGLPASGSVALGPYSFLILSQEG